MTNFPTALDTFNNPTAATPQNASGYEHDLQHANVNDAVTALQSKVGVNNSTVTTSLDYRIRQLEQGGGGGAVVSVNGLTGAVTLTTTNVAEGSNLYFTNARARTAVGASAPIGYNSTTGVFSLAQAGGSTDGYLAHADWNTFNGKENALTFSAPLTRSGNTISIPSAAGSASGYLLFSDWNTFNEKVAWGTIEDNFGNHWGSISGPAGDFPGVALVNGAIMETDGVPRIYVTLASGSSGSYTSAAVCGGLVIYDAGYDTLFQVDDTGKVALGPGTAIDGAFNLLAPNSTTQFKVDWDADFPRIYLGDPSNSSGDPEAVFNKLSGNGAADFYFGEDADEGGAFLRGQGAFGIGTQPDSDIMGLWASAIGSDNFRQFGFNSLSPVSTVDLVQKSGFHGLSVFGFGDGSFGQTYIQGISQLSANQVFAFGDDGGGSYGTVYVSGDSSGSNNRLGEIGFGDRNTGARAVVMRAGLDDSQSYYFCAIEPADFWQDYPNFAFAVWGNGTVSIGGQSTPPIDGLQVNGYGSGGYGTYGQIGWWTADGSRRMGLLQDDGDGSYGCIGLFGDSSWNNRISEFDAMDNYLSGDIRAFSFVVQTDSNAGGYAASFIPKAGDGSFVDHQLYINVTGVGIATDNPSCLLHVAGAVRIDNSTSAPATHSSPSFTSYYGNNTKALGDPNSWLLMNVGGTNYKIPLYS